MAGCCRSWRPRRGRWFFRRSSSLKLDYLMASRSGVAAGLTVLEDVANGIYRVAEVARRPEYVGIFIALALARGVQSDPAHQPDDKDNDQDEHYGSKADIHRVSSLSALKRA